MDAMKILNNCSKLDKDLYVERVAKVFVINAPFMFSTVWSGVKHVFGKRTKEKIEILGNPKIFQNFQKF